MCFGPKIDTNKTPEWNGIRKVLSCRRATTSPNLILVATNDDTLTSNESNKRCVDVLRRFGLFEKKKREMLEMEKKAFSTDEKNDEKNAKLDELNLFLRCRPQLIFNEVQLVSSKSRKKV